jgi:hypothetical protein
MKLNDELPKPVGYLGRFIFYGLAAAIIIPMLFGLLNFNSRKETAECLNQQLDTPPDRSLTALKQTQGLAACIYERSGMLARWQMRSVMSMLNSFPNAPCKFVGVWTSARPDTVWKITLKDNGEFAAEPLKGEYARESDHGGSWSVSGNQMAWFYHDPLLWPPDINQIEYQTDKRFTLIEHNGVRTQFDFLESIESSACSRR